MGCCYAVSCCDANQVRPHTDSTLSDAGAQADLPAPRPGHTVRLSAPTILAGSEAKSTGCRSPTEDIFGRSYPPRLDHPISPVRNPLVRGRIMSVVASAPEPFLVRGTSPDPDPLLLDADDAVPAAPRSPQVWFGPRRTASSAPRTVSVSSHRTRSTVTGEGASGEPSRHTTGSTAQWSRSMPRSSQGTPLAWTTSHTEITRVRTLTVSTAMDGGSSEPPLQCTGTDFVMTYDSEIFSASPRSRSSQCRMSIGSDITQSPRRRRRSSHGGRSRASQSTHPGLVSSWAPSFRRIDTVHSCRDAQGQRWVNDYVVKSKVGQGRFGEVFLVQHAGSFVNYAMKQVHKGSGGSASPQAEVEILTKLRHANIVRVFEVIDDPRCEYAFMIFEYVDGGPVMELTASGVAKGKPVPAARLRDYMQQIAVGLQYLHDHNVVHRDVKPDNILVTKKGVIKIADLGVSRLLTSSDDNCRDTSGTPLFLSPEICRGEVSSGKANDVWAFGVTAYIFVYGIAPFARARNQVELFQRIENQPIEYPKMPPESGHDPKQVPQLLRLLGRMLDRDPLTRITLNEIRHDGWVCNTSCPIPLSEVTEIREIWGSATSTSPTAYVGGGGRSFCATVPLEAVSTVRVLVVEDVFIVQKVLSKMVKNTVAAHLTVEVKCVSDGEAAIRACDATCFDLVLMDVHMSNMSGVAATGRIRKREMERAQRHAHIVGLTADAHQETHRLCLEAGMQTVLLKPLRPDDLRMILRSINVPVRDDVDCFSVRQTFAKGEVRGGAKRNAVLKSYERHLLQEVTSPVTAFSSNPSNLTTSEFDSMLPSAILSGFSMPPALPGVPLAEGRGSSSGDSGHGPPNVSFHATASSNHSLHTSGSNSGSPRSRMRPPPMSGSSAVFSSPTSGPLTAAMQRPIVHASGTKQLIPVRDRSCSASTTDNTATLHLTNNSSSISFHSLGGEENPRTRSLRCMQLHKEMYKRKNTDKVFAVVDEFEVELIAGHLAGLLYEAVGWQAAAALGPAGHARFRQELDDCLEGVLQELMVAHDNAVPRAELVDKLSSLGWWEQLVSDARSKPVTPLRPAASSAGLFQVFAAAEKGPRPHMEDQFAVLLCPGTLFSSPSAVPEVMAGVFDGHGGPEASAFCARNLLALAARHEAFAADPGAALRAAFAACNAAFIRKATGVTDAGTTALVAHARGDMLTIANAGDCRAVLCSGGEARTLSRLHVAADEGERAQVAARGGEVVHFSGTWRVNGVLSVTRSIGDLPCRASITCDPEIHRHTITSGDEFLICASDGLWDVLSPDEAVREVRLARAEIDDELLGQPPGVLTRSVLTKHSRDSTYTSRQGSRATASQGFKTPGAESHVVFPGGSPCPLEAPAAKSPRFLASSAGTDTPTMGGAEQLDYAVISEAIISEALERGSEDNITCVIIFFASSSTTRSARSQPCLPGLLPPSGTLPAGPP